MFDLNRLSLTRFSLGSEESSIAVSAQFFESMNSSAGTSVPLPVVAQFNETFNRVVQGTISVVLFFIADESLSHICIASSGLAAGMVQKLDLQAKINAIKKILVSEAESVDLETKIIASKNLVTKEAVSSILSGVAHASKDINVEDILSDSLMSSFEAINQILKPTSVQVTIPPGGELRIDSGSYTVTLNGENVLHAQSGNWLKVKPNLFRIDIETTEGGDLEGNIIYTERYL